MTKKCNQLSIVMLEASSAVGTEVINTLLRLKNSQSITLAACTPNFTCSNQE